MTCMFDRDEQCFGECSNCARYEEPECRNCGTTQKLISYEGEKYCANCLAERLVSEADETIANFVDNHYGEFVRFVASVC